MRITTDEFIKLLHGYKIKEMDVRIEITPEFSEREEVFCLDNKNQYFNARKISISYDMLQIELKTTINHNSTITGFDR